MKIKLISLSLGLLALNGWGQTLTGSFTNSTASALPDGSLVGVMEQFNVSGLGGATGGVTVGPATSLTVMGYDYFAGYPPNNDVAQINSFTPATALCRAGIMCGCICLCLPLRPPTTPIIKSFGRI